MASDTAERLGEPRGGWHWPPGSGFWGGSSPPSPCLRMGRNAASRLTLTITLGEEKAFGCLEYRLPGPEVLGGYFPFFYAAPSMWMAAFEEEKWDLGSWYCASLSVGCEESFFLLAHLLQSWMCPKVHVWGWHPGQVQLCMALGTWGSDRLRNLPPALCKGPRR